MLIIYHSMLDLIFIIHNAAGLMFVPDSAHELELRLISQVRIL